MANYMKQVAEMLGVELDEEFEVEDTFYGKKYTTRVSHIGLENYHNNGCCGGDTWITNNAMLRELLVGCVGVRILKKPWRPKDSDTFWTYYADDFQVGEGIWEGCASDYARFKSGMVFFTEKEALAARPSVYQEVTGKEWRET